jgi:hypothetical protein
VMSVEMGHDSHPAGCSLPGDEARLDAACAAFVDASQRFQEPRVSSQARLPDCKHVLFQIVSHINKYNGVVKETVWRLATLHLKASVH